ncbi:hypothetical protein BJP34_10870 [Moorena producens PAL-8-15-08-1]|uniref:Uncharacterized protein n=1 Tax=Moorena producens PAL-8-15-08-1 TaxID=1458985 RepID=A0A1D8TQF8_9CYAN|nr:hypothetical protein BJP34_10870 [Moorena producens PAL-8-15-08-1]
MLATATKGENRLLLEFPTILENHGIALATAMGGSSAKIRSISDNHDNASLSNSVSYRKCQQLRIITIELVIENSSNWG